MIVHKPSKSLLLSAPDPRVIKQLLPKHRDISFEGHNLAVPHRLDEVRVLRNMGIEAPPPILFYYDWPGRHQPLPHQKETAAFLTLHSRAFCFNQMGTMKTASALWAADYLMNIGQVRRVIVVCPLSTVDVVWLEEIFNVLMHRRAVVLHGSRERRKELLATDSDFYIINHHGLGVIADELKSRNDIDLAIGDECDVYRNSGTDLYDHFKAATAKRRLWLMSGTPFPNAPTDAWALARLINPTRVPQYFSQWKRQTMMQVSQFKWVPRKDSYERAYQACQPAIRFLKKDCISLPPVTMLKRQCDLSPEQKKAAQDMKNKAVAEAKHTKITAVNAADKINKMRQIYCGVVKHGEEYIAVDHKPRLTVLLDCIQQAAAKVIVVVPFKGIVRALDEELRDAGYSVAVMNGDIKRNARRETIGAFKYTTDPHILLCHPKVMSHGLNLAEADTIIFYGPIYSPGEHQQVMDRIARPGQKNDMTIVRIASSHLEWEIYRILDERHITQENILSLYKHEILGIE